MDGRTIEVFEGNSRAARQALRLVTEGQVCRDRMCPLTTECVLLLQNVFSYHSSLKARFVEFRFLGFRSLGFICIHIDISICKDRGSLCPASSNHRMCSLTTECVLLLQNVFSRRARLAQRVALGAEVTNAEGGRRGVVTAAADTMMREGVCGVSGAKLSPSFSGSSP